MYFLGLDIYRPTLELKTRAPGSLGQGLDPAVEPIAAAVEHHHLDPSSQRPPSQETAHQAGHILLYLALGAGRALRTGDALLGPGRLLAVCGCADVRFQVRSSHQSSARLVVDDLAIDMLQAAEHAEPRPLGSPHDPLSHPLVAPQAGGGCRLLSLHLLATACRPCPPCPPFGGPFHPDSACPCPCRAP